MNYWDYERAVTKSGIWVRKGIPWEEEKPSSRHPDRKITHVYECLFNTKHQEYYSDHSLGNIWLKSCVIAITSPLVTVIQTIYHLIGFGLIKELCTRKSEIPLSKRCIRELKNIALVPFYGFYQTILALGIIFSAPFSKEATYNLRRKIGKLQLENRVKPYFADTFQRISRDDVERIIQNKLQNRKKIFRGIQKAPVYKSTTHSTFVDSDTNNPGQRLSYYTRSHAEFFRSYKKDYRTAREQEFLMQKVNESYKLLPKEPLSKNSGSVTFDLENNITQTIPNETTYDFIKKFKTALSRSSMKFNARTKRFLAHSLDDIYESSLNRYSKRLSKNSGSTTLVKKIGKAVRKNFSTFLNKYVSESEENKKFLPSAKVTKATKKLRKIVRSSSFTDSVQKDFSLLTRNQEFFSKLKNRAVI